MPATISSTFAIEYTQAAAQGSLTITNPGRSFRVLSATGTGVSGSVITVRKNDLNGATVAVVNVLNAAGGGSDTLADQPGTVTLANADLSASDNLFVTVGTQNATEVKLFCVASGGGQSLTVS